jgi:hypothetical protein
MEMKMKIRKVCEELRHEKRPPTKIQSIRAARKTGSWQWAQMKAIMYSVSGQNHLTNGSIQKCGFCQASTTPSRRLNSLLPPDPSNEESTPSRLPAGPYRWAQEEAEQSQKRPA